MHLGQIWAHGSLSCLLRCSCTQIHDRLRTWEHLGPATAITQPHIVSRGVLEWPDNQCLSISDGDTLFASIHRHHQSRSTATADTTVFSAAASNVSLCHNGISSAVLLRTSDRYYSDFQVRICHYISCAAQDLHTMIPCAVVDAFVVTAVDNLRNEMTHTGVSNRSSFRFFCTKRENPQFTAVKYSSAIGDFESEWEILKALHIPHNVGCLSCWDQGFSFPPPDPLFPDRDYMQYRVSTTHARFKILIQKAKG